jgi:hypothetical protein
MSYRVTVHPSLKSLLTSGVIFTWVFLSWAGPAMVGLWTQIRKGLPEFARAPRTIMAAGNHEAHRLVYVGAAVALWMGIETAVRLLVVPGVLRTGPPASVFMLFLLNVALAGGVAGFAAASWVGPLRSDYTRQLVQSRLHAARILLMYAFLLPCAAAIIAAGTLYLLFPD